jgi:hypothetical protein
LLAIERSFRAITVLGEVGSFVRSKLSGVRVADVQRLGQHEISGSGSSDLGDRNFRDQVRL